MTIANTEKLTLEAAQKILRSFNCIKPHNTQEIPPHDVIRQALLLVAENSDYQILGICADNAEHGILALNSYATALGYEAPTPTAIPGIIYIKFNPKSNLCYMEDYFGEYRGVLVSCQSAYDYKINEMYGHLPLDLFT